MFEKIFIKGPSPHCAQYIFYIQYLVMIFVLGVFSKVNPSCVFDANKMTWKFLFYTKKKDTVSLRGQTTKPYPYTLIINPIFTNSMTWHFLCLFGLTNWTKL